jgi:hypothetical protein
MGRSPVRTGPASWVDHSRVTTAGEMPRGVSAMQERVKVFTYSSGTGSTLIESTLEDHLNEWLRKTRGRITSITQSESERNGMAHVTVSVWYVPEDAN